MTAQAYNALDGDSLGADKIIRATTMQSLYDNPTAIAQRGSGAPWNNGIGAIAVLTSGSGNWTVPDGVYRIKVTAVGGGGGGGGSANGGNGGNTTFSTVTANGGSGGASGAIGGAGGTATGGDINIPGQRGQDANTASTSGGRSGGSSLMGFGGLSTNTDGHGYGGGGASADYNLGGGGGGGTAIKIFTTTPGGTLAYSIGAAGAQGSTSAGAGTAGVIIIEY